MRLPGAEFCGLETVFWPGGWGCGQDREGPLRVEGKLL
jgi:hypothetical protein